MPLETMYAAMWQASLDDIDNTAVKNCLIILREWLMMVSDAIEALEEKKAAIQ